MKILRNIFPKTVFELFTGVFEGVIMDKPCKNKQLYSKMDGALFHPIVCDHELNHELHQMVAIKERTSASLFYLVSRGIEELLSLQKEYRIDEERQKRRVSKTVRLVTQILSKLPENSLFCVLVSSEISGFVAQTCKAYLFLS